MSTFEKSCRWDWQNDRKLQREFGTFKTYLAFKKAEKQGMTATALYGGKHRRD